MTRHAYNSTLPAQREYMKRAYIKRRPSKRPPPPPTTLKRYDRILMPLWRALVILRAGGRCEKCGRSDRQLAAHHLWRKDILSLRWNPDNGACLCNVPCHLYGEPGNPSAHDNLEGCRQMIREKRGEEWYNRMFERYLLNWHISEVDVALEKSQLELGLRRI